MVDEFNEEAQKTTSTYRTWFKHMDDVNNSNDPIPTDDYSRFGRAHAAACKRKRNR